MQRLARLVPAACLAISAFAGGFGSASATPFAIPERPWPYEAVQRFEDGFQIGGVRAQTSPVAAWWSRPAAAEFSTFIGLSIGRVFDGADVVAVSAAPAALFAPDVRSIRLAGALPAAIAGTRELSIGAADLPLREHAGAPAFAGSSLPALPTAETYALAAAVGPHFSPDTALADERRLEQHFAALHADDFGQLTFDGVVISTSNVPHDAGEGGAHVAIPALRRSVALDLAGHSQQLRGVDATSYSYAPGDIFGATDTVPVDPLAAKLDASNFVDSRQAVYSAGVSLPVTKDVVLGVGYNTQGYYGAYETAPGQNISKRKDEYTASMTYTIPKTTSSFSALVGNQKYTDYVLPTFNFDQNREALNFSVRF